MIAFGVDVGSGSLRVGTFGWARARRDSSTTLVQGGSTIEALLDLVEGDSRKRRPFALGVVSPEIHRSAQPAESQPIGLWTNKLAQILASLKLRVPDLRMTLDNIPSVETDATTVLLWKACVTSEAGPTTEDLVERAASAAARFLDDLQAERLSVSAGTEPGGSLLGTALLMSGFAADLAIARQPSITVQSTQLWSGPIERV